MRVVSVFLFFLATLFVSGQALAQLPQGYLVWIKGVGNGDRLSRKVHRMTLPDRTDEIALTSGEDVECQVSPDGQWVAYAKAKRSASDYHQFNRWSLHVVSIHGINNGGQEIRIDDSGYWPSWGTGNVLYYSQTDAANAGHTHVVRAELGEDGTLLSKSIVFSTFSAYSALGEVNECFMAPDGSWFAARTRGSESVNGVAAFNFGAPSYYMLGQAGAVGCMPNVAPSGTWGVLAGREFGILWGDGPSAATPQTNITLIPPLGAGDFVYHPGFATDESFVMASHGVEDDHNAGNYNLHIYRLNGREATEGQPLVEGGFNGWPHLWVGDPATIPPPRPRVVSFTPDTYTILNGETVTLSWVTSFADMVTLDGVGVTPEGNTTDTPAASKQYTLVAGSTTSAATHTMTVDVTVNATPQPVVVELFEANPPRVEEGSTSTLTWRVLNAYTVDVNGSAVAPTGSMDVTPSVDTAYSLTAQGHEGPVTATVTVIADPLPSGLIEDQGRLTCAIGALGARDSLLLLFGLASPALLLRWSRRRRRAANPDA